VRHLGNRLTVALMLAPALIVILTLFVGGLALGMAQSLGYLPFIGRNSVSLDAYVTMVMNPAFLQSLVLTLCVSVLTTLLTVILAVVTALTLRRRFRGKRIITYVYQIPLTIPHLVVAVGILMLVSQSGLVARVAYHLNIIADPSEFPALVYDDWGIGIMLVYLWKQVPFIGLVVLAVLQSVGADYEELARSLGAGRWQAFRHVLVPLIVPGIVPASIIIFAYVFGSFEVPFLLGKSFPTMLSVLSYRLYVDVDLHARPQAMAISMFIAGFVLLLVLVYRKITNVLFRKEG
jgi:putative spermidine/putrescine transport system permease protein